MEDEHRSSAAHVVTGTEHVIVLTEQEMPRAFEIRCTACHTVGAHGACTAACHRVTWTPWGEQHASDIGALHIFYMEKPKAPRIHQQMTHRGGRVR